MNIPYVFRKCTKCGRWLVASSKYFRKAKGYKYGLRADCKECEKKYMKKYRKQNKETLAEYNNEYNKKYREQNKETLAEYGKKYREQNKERLAEYKKEYNKKYREQNKERLAEYRKQNKERIVERSKKWYEANKEHKAEYDKVYYKSPRGQVIRFNNCSKRRAKEQNQGSGITKEQWLEMMSFFNWECAYSGKYIGGDTKDRTIDHIDPLNKGGANEIWNCIPMDRSLNSSKRDKEMLDWYIKQPFCTAERLLKIYKWQEYAKNKFLKK